MIMSVRRLPEEWITTPALAEAVGVDPRTVRRWRKVGGGPSWYNVGRRVYYRRVDVMKWLEEGKVER